MLSEISPMLIVLLLLGIGMLVKLIIGLVIVLRARPVDLPKITEGLGRWFSPRLR